MTHIEYNHFGTDSVVVKFKCGDCGHVVTTDDLSVPLPDFSAETTSESYSNDCGFAVCTNCKKEFDITIWASFSDGYIEIPDIDDEDVIEVIEDGEKLAAYYKQQIDTILLNFNSLEIFEREIANVRQLNEIMLDNESLEKTLKRQLLSGAITCMEDYLSDKIINSVLKNEVLFKNFVRTFHGMRNRKFELSEIFEKHEQLQDIVKKELLTIIYHDLPKVKGIYQDTFKIDFPEISDLTVIVLRRHDMVHRNGKTMDGVEINVDKEMVTDAIIKVEKLISTLDQKIKLLDK